MRVVLVAVAALALAGAVLAAGPSPVAMQGSRSGVVAPGGKIRYVALPRGGTVVAAVRVRDGRVPALEPAPGRVGDFRGHLER